VAAKTNFGRDGDIVGESNYRTKTAVYALVKGVLKTGIWDLAKKGASSS
jgi:hypothetical protein